MMLVYYCISLRCIRKIDKKVSHSYIYNFGDFFSFNLVLGCGTIGIEKDCKWKWSSYIFCSLQLYFMHLISIVSLFGMHWADNISPILLSRKQLIEGGSKLGGDLSRYLELREKSISRCSRKTSISALLTMPKPLTVWITINCGKF